MLPKLSFAIISILIVVLLGIITYWEYRKGTPIVSKANLPEEIVFVRSDDDIVNGGVLFSRKKNDACPVAIGGLPVTNCMTCLHGLILQHHVF